MAGWKVKRVGRYWVCSHGCAGQPPAPHGPPRCLWCSKPMFLRERPREEWEGVPAWYCEEHRLGPVPTFEPPQKKRPNSPRKKKPMSVAEQQDRWLSERDRYKPRKKPPKKGRVIVVPDTGEPLGNRSVNPGSMYKKRDGG